MKIPRVHASDHDEDRLTRHRPADVPPLRRTPLPASADHHSGLLCLLPARPGFHLVVLPPAKRQKGRFACRAWLHQAAQPGVSFDFRSRQPNGRNGPADVRCADGWTSRTRRIPSSCTRFEAGWEACDRCERWVGGERAHLVGCSCAPIVLVKQSLCVTVGFPLCSGEGIEQLGYGSTQNRGSRYS